MFRFFRRKPEPAPAPKLVGVLWFIHNEADVTEKVPYTNEHEMLTAVEQFLSEFGGNHETEFLVIFCDDDYTKRKIQNIAKRITEYEYPVNATNVANKLF